MSLSASDYTSIYVQFCMYRVTQKCIGRALLTQVYD